MADEEVVALEPVAGEELPAPLAGEVHPVVAEEEAKPEKHVALPGNCAGELELQPAEAEGLTFNKYKCKECGQIVHVGLEHLELYGLPLEHHKLEEEGAK